MNESTFNTVVKALADKVRDLESEVSWLEHQLKEREKICDRMKMEVDECRALIQEYQDTLPQEP